MPFTERDGFFGWGTWVEVELPVYEQYYELYDEDGSSEPLKRGSLANDLPAYAENTLGHPVLIQFRDATKRPSLHFSAADSSGLAVERREGMDGHRYHQICDQLST